MKATVEITNIKEMETLVLQLDKALKKISDFEFDISVVSNNNKIKKLDSFGMALQNLNQDELQTKIFLKINELIEEVNKLKGE